jgi:NitT/TauT family transport system permease protein
MMIVWFGTGMLSKVVMAAFSVFFVTLSQVYEGARSVSNERLTLARSLAASSGRVARLIIVPGSLLWVLSALKMNVSLALVGAFIGEFVSSEAGLGHYILKAGSLYDMPRVLFGIALISLLALTLTKVIDPGIQTKERKGNCIAISFQKPSSHLR